MGARITGPRRLGVAALALAATLAAGALTPAGALAAETQQMYRLYNPNSGEHFYTAKAAERDSVVKAGWNYEGIGWTAPKTSDTPVYRVYSGTDHHYTTNKAERDHLVSVGWKDEGVGWYSDDAKGVPLYRQFNPNVDPSAPRNNSGSHNYTTNKAENDNLVKAGWRAEGIGWYGVDAHAEPTKDTFTVTFDANGGEGTMARQTYNVNQIGPMGPYMPENAFTNPGKWFYSWNTKPDGSGEFFVNEQAASFVGHQGQDAGTNITLYAQWADEGQAPVLVTVSDENGNYFNVDASMTDAAKATRFSSRTGYKGITFVGATNKPHTLTIKAPAGYRILEIDTLEYTGEDPTTYTITEALPEHYFLPVTVIVTKA